MKIAHIGLASYFTESMSYQENQLVEQNIKDGHEVLLVSNDEKYENGDIVKTGYEDRILQTGLRLVRMPYKRIINKAISDRLRKVNGLYELLQEYSPDIIFCHNLCSLSVLDVVKYKKAYPKIKLYADTHTSCFNSASNWLSLHVLHRIIYRRIVNKALPYLEKYFYISSDCRDFSRDNYGIPDNVMEFYPLGGNLPEEKECVQAKANIRRKLGMTDEELLFVHSGKLDEEKLTKELLRAFAEVPELKARLVIIGSIPDNMKCTLSALIEGDDRVEYLGWKCADELREYLLAADLYLQPGSASSTMQNAICAGRPVMSYPHEFYLEGYDYGNFIWVKNETEILESFNEICRAPERLKMLSEKSWKCARELLDYRVLAARLYK